MTMTFSEAMQCLEKGKMVRLSSWQKDYYVCRVGQNLINQNGDTTFLPIYGDMIKKSWELYEEQPDNKWYVSTERLHEILDEWETPDNEAMINHLRYLLSYEDYICDRQKDDDKGQI